MNKREDGETWAWEFIKCSSILSASSSIPSRWLLLQKFFAFLDILLARLLVHCAILLAVLRWNMKWNINNCRSRPHNLLQLSANETKTQQRTTFRASPRRDYNQQRFTRGSPSILRHESEKFLHPETISAKKNFSVQLGRRNFPSRSDGNESSAEVLSSMSQHLQSTPPRF